MQNLQAWFLISARKECKICRSVRPLVAIYTTHDKQKYLLSCYNKPTMLLSCRHTPVFLKWFSEKCALASIRVMHLFLKKLLVAILNGCVVWVGIMQKRSPCYNIITSFKVKKFITININTTLNNFVGFHNLYSTWHNSCAENSLIEQSFQFNWCVLVSVCIMSTVQGSQGKVRESERLKDDGRLDVSCDVHSLTLHPGGVIFRWWRLQRSSLEQKLLLQHY